LTDFGLAKQIITRSGATRTGHWVGTLDYVAPEQLTGEPVDARSDVYALGCLLYQTLTGSIPFARDGDAAKLWAHMNDPPPTVTAARPELPRALDDVVARAMAKEPEARHPSAGDLGRAAVAAVEDRPPAPERSVASGAAAPPTAGAAAPTQAISARGGPSAGQGAAARTEPLPASRAPARRLPRWALALVVLAIAGGGVLAGRASAGGSSGQGKRTAADPNKNYAAAVNRVFDDLHRARRPDLSSLQRARDSSELSTAARALWQDYRSAWRHLPPPPSLTPAERGVTQQLGIALQAVGNKYHGMADAAQPPDPAQQPNAAAYEDFRRALGVAQRQLQQAVSMLKQLGYDVA
jgi:hypothetical protein